MMNFFLKLTNDIELQMKKASLENLHQGLFVMETFFLTPQMFDHYIASDP